MDEFVTELIVNLVISNCQYRTYLLYNIFLTFPLHTPGNRNKINSHFYPQMCNLLTNVSLKDENIKFSPKKCKKCDKYIYWLTSISHR